MKRPSSKQPKERKPLTGSLPAGGDGTMIAHDLNGVWHNGIAGTEDNFMALDATGLPKDSGNKASDFAAAAHTQEGSTILYTPRKITTSQNSLSTDSVVLCDTRAAGITYTILTTDIAVVGRRISIIDLSREAVLKPITITPQTGTINGAASYVISGAGNSVEVVSDGTNLTVVNQIDDLFMAAYPNQAATPSHAISLMNPTAATNGAQQDSPAQYFQGYGFETTGNTSKIVEFRMFARPVQSTTLVTSKFLLQGRYSGTAAWKDLAYVTQAGTLVLTGNISASNTYIGIGNVSAGFANNSTVYTTANQHIGIGSNMASAANAICVKLGSLLTQAINGGQLLGVYNNTTEMAYFDRLGGLALGSAAQFKFHPQEVTPGACTAGTPTAGGAVTAGTHSYKITFVTADGETAASAKSNVITTAGENLTVPLTNIPCGSPLTTSRKIYRTDAGDAGNYKLIATIADNVTTVYNDTSADGEGAVAPTTNTTASRILTVGSAPLIISPATLEDGSAATTQAAGDNSTKLATTAFVQTAVASVTGEVRFTPSSDMAKIRTALADSTTPLIKFGAGTYDHGANNVILAANKRLFLEGSNEWKVDAGNQVMTWTAADSARYWSISDAVRSVYWDGANTRFIKREGANFPSIASSAEGFYAILRDRKYLVSSTDVANNYLYVVETPIATTKMDANSAEEAQYVAIFKPTSNLHIHGNLKITQNSGAPQKICSLVGLVDSSICADGVLEFSQPSGSATAAGDAATCLISQIWNTRMNLALRKMSSTNSSTWWVWLQYTFKSYFYQMFEDVYLNYAGSTSGEHIGFHNTYLYGCNYVIAGGGLRTNSTAGANPVVRGSDFVYYEDPQIQGHSRDVETAIGTNAYGIAFGTCLAGTGSSFRNTTGFIGTIG